MEKSKETAARGRICSCMSCFIIGAVVCARGIWAPTFGTRVTKGCCLGAKISSVGYEHFVACFSTFGSEGNEPSSKHGTWHMWSISTVWAVDTLLDVALAYGYQYNVLYDASEIWSVGYENFVARNQNFVAVSPRRLWGYGRHSACTFHRPMLPGSPRAFRCTIIVQNWPILGRDGRCLFPQIDTLLSIWSCFVDFSPTILPNHCAHFPLHDPSSPNSPFTNSH